MVSAEEILIRIKGQDDSGSAFSSVQQRAGALKTAAGAAVTAMSASMLSYAKTAVDSAMTAEQEWMKFGNAVQNTGGNWEQQSDNIKKWVKEYSNSMGRSVADTRAAMTTYMNMGMSLKESQEAMKATSNYAAQMGISQEEAAGQLQKAFMGNGRALKQLGLNIDDYKNKTTGAIDRQKLLNAILERTGGAADKYANSSTAKFQRLNNVLASLKTDFGATLLDAITPLIPVVQNFLNLINGLPGPVKTVGFAVVALGAGLGLIAGPLTSIIGLFQMMGITLPTISGLMGILGGETAALTAEELALAAAEAGLTVEEIASAAAHASNGVAVAAEGVAAAGASTGFWAMAAAELAALWPVLLIIAAVAALIVVVEKIGEAIGWWKDFGTMLEAIRAGIMRLWEAFINSPQVQAVIQGITWAFQQLWNFVKPIIDWISQAVMNLFKGAGNVDFIGAIISAFQTLGNIASTVFSYMRMGWNAVMTALQPVFNAIKNIINIFQQLFAGQMSIEQAIWGILTTLGNMYATIAIMIYNLAQRIATSVLAYLKTLPGKIGQILTQVGARIGALAGMIAARAAQLGSRILTGIVARLRALPGRVNQILLQIPARILGIVGAAVGAAANLAMQLVQAVVNGVMGVGNAVFNEFMKIGNRIRDAVSSAVQAALSFGNDVKNAVLNALGIHSPGIIQRKIAIEFQDIPGRIDENIASAYRSAQNYANNILTGFNTPSYNMGQLQAMNTGYTPVSQTRNGDTYIFGAGAFQIDARNKTETEAKQMLVLALEGLSGNENIRGI